jgi:hypothetical protein
MWDYVCVYITNADSKALQKLEAIATGNSIRCIVFPAFSRPYILSEDFLLLHAAQIASLTAETDTGMKYLPAVNTSHLHQLSASILSLSDNTVVFPKTSYQNLTALKLIDVMSSVSDAFYSSLDHLATSTGRLREITLIFRLRCVEMRVEPITALIRANRSTLLDWIGLCIHSSRSWIRKYFGRDRLEENGSDAVREVGSWPEDFAEPRRLQPICHRCE